jgi:hypothetical protein
VAEYARNMAEGQELRSQLTTVLTRHGLRWCQVDKVAHKIALPA